MRRRRLLPLPLALIVELPVAAPAGAVEWTVEALDFAFAPKHQRVERGDTVVWSFTGAGHSTTSRPGQAESWDSKVRASGERFAYVFDTPGRYQYFCTPHESVPMAGVITVGADVATFDAFRTKPSGPGARISFELNQPAKMTYTLTGPTPRRVERARLGKGKHRFTVKNLRPGSYRGRLVLRDDFDKRESAKKAFVIR